MSVHEAGWFLSILSVGLISVIVIPYIQAIVDWLYVWRAARRYDRGPGSPMNRHKKPWYRTW